ncbi:MAG: hypothetical protein MRY81_15800 [Donghicola eburneus]|nr:hypothetical protein [Donghicola eburneus]MBY8964302.1 hypothetical protein [Algiphilus acroporae]MCI5041134.1 hypothetical protein [Donghicola eburneus]
MTIKRGISTEALGYAIGSKAASIRVRYCRTGSYYGIKPTKLPNGRLLWPEDSLDRLISAGTNEKSTN